LFHAERVSACSREEAKRKATIWKTGRSDMICEVSRVKSLGAECFSTSGAGLGGHEYLS
jgi:hypothetical protein